jgi:hypothetical protein
MNQHEIRWQESIHAGSLFFFLSWSGTEATKWAIITAHRGGDDDDCCCCCCYCYCYYYYCCCCCCGAMSGLLAGETEVL